MPSQISIRVKIILILLANVLLIALPFLERWAVSRKRFDSAFKSYAVQLTPFPALDRYVETQGPLSGPLLGTDDWLYFIHRDEQGRRILMKSDGQLVTFVKNVSLTDGLNVSASWVFEHEDTALAFANNTLYILAAASPGSFEGRLWQSDGTPWGTIPMQCPQPIESLAAIAFSHASLSFQENCLIWRNSEDPMEATPGYGSNGSLLGSVNLDNRFFFWWAGLSLMRTDGTRTLPITLMRAANPYMGNLIAFSQDTLFFTIFNGDKQTHQVWKTDGTVEGTNLFFEPDTYRISIFMLNGQLAIWEGGDWPRQTTWQLWCSDGTEVNEFLYETGSPPYPRTMLEGANSFFYFHRSDDENSYTLWEATCLKKGTTLIKTGFNPDSDSPPDNLLYMDGLLFFTADDGTHGEELWVSNGTPSGTRMVQDINPGNTGSSPNRLTAANHQLFFTAKDATGFKWWVLSFAKK
jgi:ELWxxDGT repeat protein